MGKLKPFIFGLVFGGGIAFVALQYHLVRSDEGFRLIPRSPQPSIGLAYVDIRNWAEAEWKDREELAGAVVESDSTDLVQTSLEGVSSVSVSTDGSAFEKLRNVMEGSENSFESNPSADDSGFLTIPQEDDSSKDSQNLFSIPFPNEARASKKSTIASRDDVSDSSRTDVARRDLPSIEEILGEASNTADDARESSSWPQKSQNKLRSSFEAQQDTESLEAMLFEDISESSDSEASEQDSSSGLFQDISDEVRDRTGNAVDRAGEAFQYESNKAFKDSRNSIDRYVRDQVDSILPDSVSSMFEEDSATSNVGDARSKEPVLAPALKAIQDGFDPFIK